jgi:hypothetical protein
LRRLSGLQPHQVSRILAGFIGQIKRVAIGHEKRATDAAFDQLPAGLDGSQQIPATL